MPQPTSKHHAEWLSLLEISGPFLSMPVLTAAFPQGLDELDPGQTRSLRADYEFWTENLNSPAVHTAWGRLVLESLLGYSSQVLLTGQAIAAGWKAEFPEHEETLRPDMLLVDPTSGTKAPHLLIQIYPPSQDLEKAVQGSRWQASVATRMMELCHATEVRLGLVTNGEHWMLVDAPRGETTGFISWYSELWFDEPITLRAFKSLLGVQRFFGVAEDQTLESLLKASANDQQEITDQLGLQVRHAVEILIQKIDQADQDSGGVLLGADVPPALLYEAALTVMMRLVFMLSAEERKLLPLDDSLYAENYAVSTLYAQLDVTEEEVLERRFDAWSRLLAVFRVVYHGIRHERLNLPPYGSSLFDPDKYPFLEGRTSFSRKDAKSQREPQEKTLAPLAALRHSPEAFTGEPVSIPLPVNNRTVLHLLKALQILQVEGEARRISFRALDVEQIGHVYEGLLDHIAVRASELVVGLRGAKRQEPEVALSILEDAAKKKDLLAWLKNETGRSESALRNALAPEFLQKDPELNNRLRATIGNDARLFARLAPFAGLLRADDFGAAVVILPGSVYVSSGTTRRATGTHYTPRSLTEPVVQHTLEPLVYDGPAEGLPREQWRLRSPQELLALKICDMAMGSGGFLVQVVRYLAERLVEAWQLYGEDLSDGDASGVRIQQASANDTGISDPLILARRLVAERCIYGVDKNPLAVEIAKLSLWLVTMAKDLPFSFLDHALKCGDSLVGCSEDDFLRWAHGYQASAMTLFDEQLRLQLETARAKRRELESFVVNDAQDSARKASLLREAEAAMAHIKRGADLLTGARLLGLKSQELEALQLSLLFPYMAGKLDGDLTLTPAPSPKERGEPGFSLLPAGEGPGMRALAAAQKERVFHWEFEFPEVFERGGFSAFVGNPPFIGGQKITGYLGVSYREFLVNYIASGNRGSSDLCGYFFLKASLLLNHNGILGLIATNTIAQGVTREIALESVVKNKFHIYQAIQSMRWPGSANLYISIIWMTKKPWMGTYLLDDKKVKGVTPFLTETSASDGNPFQLKENEDISFMGTTVLGTGFTLPPYEAKTLIDKNPDNKDVLFPYINGIDVYTQPDQNPTRWIINFGEWDYDKASHYHDCMEIVIKQVKPQREAVTYSKNARENWWRFERVRPALYGKIKALKKVLVKAQVSSTWAWVFIPNGWVYDAKLLVFAIEAYAGFTVLQSSFHWEWSLLYGTTLKTDLSYTPTTNFQTYPFPPKITELEQIGEAYHETRQAIMVARQEGLTKTYNRFHKPEEHSADIAELRRLHVTMDQAVAAAYGWADLDLGHGFHETAQGTRYTISEPARREVLSRLLKLNHERWEEEQLQGPTEKPARPRKNTLKRTEDQKKKKEDEKPEQYGLF